MVCARKLNDTSVNCKAVIYLNHKIDGSDNTVKLKKTLAVSLVLCGLLTPACYAKDNSKSLTVDEPRAVNGSIEFSMTPNADMKDINILTALYRDNKLCNVKINALSGTFKTEDSDNYTLKIFTWEKGTMKPFGECYTYPNIKEKGKLKRELNNTLQEKNGTIPKLLLTGFSATDMISSAL